MNNIGEKVFEVQAQPEYTVQKLIEDYRKRVKLEYVFFWGHHPAPNGLITTSCLSQWWEQKFLVGNQKYFCMEQYMMAEKARLFGDTAIEKQIINCKDPKDIKDLGRKIRDFKEETWNKHKYAIVLNGNYNKFSQNEELKKYLLSTKAKILVEASPYDNIWGIKMGASDKSINNPSCWKGQNLLGFALMEVRVKIKE